MYPEKWLNGLRFSFLSIIIIIYVCLYAMKEKRQHNHLVVYYFTTVWYIVEEGSSALDPSGFIQPTPLSLSLSLSPLDEYIQKRKEFH